MKKLILLGACLGLSGCASFHQGVAAYGAQAVEGAKMANDNIISGWTVMACATPLSAALRNPQIIPALKALCMPQAGLAPETLLDQPARQPVPK